MTSITEKLSYIALACALASTSAMAEDNRANGSRPAGKLFEVTITNLTRGQSFTPLLAATHSPRLSFFTLGEPATPGLALLAEAGDTSLLASELASTGGVSETATNGALLLPGATVSIRIRANRFTDELSVAGMLIPTNDSFVALNGLDLPWSGAPVVRMLSAYDAGSEPNDELCANIPGPVCGGQGGSPAAGGEGYVHVSAGVHGQGDLVPAQYDWRNPVARVVVRRVD
jgi:Spondin_N